MDSKTAEHLRRLNTELDAWASQLDHYSHAQLNGKPADGGWSAMQCIHHMMLSESGSMAYIEKKLSFSPELPGKGLSDIWKRMLLNGYLASPVKFKAPQGIGTEFLPEESDWAATLRDWKAQRKQMQRQLESIAPKYYEKRVFKHPLAGRVSIATTLSFLNAHFQRHRKQAMRAIREQNA